MWINELSPDKSTKYFVIFLGKQAMNLSKLYLNLAKGMKILEWVEKLMEMIRSAKWVKSGWRCKVLVFYGIADYWFPDNASVKQAASVKMETLSGAGKNILN